MNISGSSNKSSAKVFNIILVFLLKLMEPLEIFLWLINSPFSPIDILMAYSPLSTGKNIAEIILIIIFQQYFLFCFKASSSIFIGISDTFVKLFSKSDTKHLNNIIPLKQEFWSLLILYTSKNLTLLYFSFNTSSTFIEAEPINSSLSLHFTWIKIFWSLSNTETGMSIFWFHFNLFWSFLSPETCLVFWVIPIYLTSKYAFSYFSDFWIIFFFPKYSPLKKYKDICLYSLFNWEGLIYLFSSSFLVFSSSCLPSYKIEIDTLRNPLILLISSDSGLVNPIQ